MNRYRIAFFVVLSVIIFSTNTVFAGYVEDAQVEDAQMRAELVAVGAALQRFDVALAAEDVVAAEVAYGEAEAAQRRASQSFTAIGTVRNRAFNEGFAEPEEDGSTHPTYSALLSLESAARGSVNQYNGRISTALGSLESLSAQINDANIAATTAASQAAATNQVGSDVEQGADEAAQGGELVVLTDADIAAAEANAAQSAAAASQQTAAQQTATDQANAAAAEANAAQQAGAQAATASAVAAQCAAQNTGIVPCGNGGQECRCTICHFVLLGYNIVEFFRNLLVITCVMIIMIAGVTYILSAGDSGMTGLAKTAIKSAFLGVIIVLTAWVVIAFVMSALARGDGPLGIYANSGSLWSFSCQ